VRTIFFDPQHPYTLGLLGSIPKLGVEEDRLATIPGTVPNPQAMPSGCLFNPRCPIAIERCRVEEPLLRPLALEGRGPDDLVACHRAEEVAAGAFPVLAGSWAGAGTAVGAGSLPLDGTPVGGTPAAAAS
jgi:oligopeptide/dipeptide ABC transporter ATP-binding protein